jgi:23S rRNA pseudouridine2605 synthase
MRAQPPGRRAKPPSGSGSRGPNPDSSNPRSSKPRSANVRSAIPRGAIPRGAARRGAAKHAAPKDAPATERVQKLLAAAGIGSRREVERWIREGRLEINGEVPQLGHKLAARDRITLDGRPIRLRAPAANKELRVLLFHRSPGENLDLKEATSRAAEHLNLPKASGRWLAIQPMPPVDGGLEILTDDGAWAHHVSRGAHALTVDYVLRMRGPLNESLVEEFRAATDCEGEPMSIIEAKAKFGEGQNHWLDVTARATRSALVRHWWAARGIIVSRLMRVRFGPVHLARDLPRGHSRALLASERNALNNEIEAALLAAGAAQAGNDPSAANQPAGPAL